MFSSTLDLMCGTLWCLPLQNYAIHKYCGQNTSNLPGVRLVCVENVGALEIDSALAGRVDCYFGYQLIN